MSFPRKREPALASCSRIRFVSFLQTWFYAIYLFIATPHGVSAKELQRTLGVTYRPDWRIVHQIRDLMDKADEFQMLKGHVEID